MTEADMALSFGAAAQSYARVRPGYPAAALDFVLAGMQPERILDLGAGTGKLTSALRGRSASLLAIDPDPMMLRELARCFPEVSTAVAFAEATGLPDAQLDAVFVGQAFHWFRRPAADREISRILRPGGVAGLLWNFPDTEVNWVAALYDATTGSSPARHPQSNLAQGLFDVAEQRWFDGSHLLAGPDGLLELVFTWSWVITQSETAQAQTRERVRAVISEHEQLQRAQIDLPTRTKAVRQYRR